jgi:tRNA threonylcarbamoyladenosine biosynthesis protein TsaB
MILAINTSTAQFGLALHTERGHVVSECLISPGPKNFKGFMPGIVSLLENSDTDINELNAIIVVKGPGSFTGLRVGLSTAKGMARGLQIPIIGVSSLEVMASQLSYTRRTICSMIDSRKGEVFFALFRGDGNNLIRISDNQSVRLQDIQSVIKTETIFIGNDFEKQGNLIGELFGDEVVLAQPYLWNLRASAVGNFGLQRFAANDFDDSRDLVPSYMQPPDIRPNPFPLLEPEC